MVASVEELRKRWKQIIASIWMVSEVDVETLKQLHDLLEECRQTGTCVPDGPARSQLKWMAREISDAIFRFEKKQYPIADVLDYAGAEEEVSENVLSKLSKQEYGVLEVIAACRMPVEYKTLLAIAVRKQPYLCPDEDSLKGSLDTLIEYGLLERNRQGDATRFDLPSGIRGIVWDRMSIEGKERIDSLLEEHFKAVPIPKRNQVETWEQLTPAIECYNILIRKKDYDGAVYLLREHLSSSVTLYRLTAVQEQIALLKQIFTGGAEALPHVRNREDQIFLLNELAKAYHFAGNPTAAIPLFQRACDFANPKVCAEYKEGSYWEGEKRTLAENLYWLSDSHRAVGKLCEAEKAAWKSVSLARKQQEELLEAAGLYRLGLVLGVKGSIDDAIRALRRSNRIWAKHENQQDIGRVNAYLAQIELWAKRPAEAKSLAEQAWEVVQPRPVTEGSEDETVFKPDFIRAARLLGTCYLNDGSAGAADAYRLLDRAAKGAAICGLVDEEVPSLLALVELKYRESAISEARALLERAQKLSGNGGYRLFLADIWNLRARIQKDEAKDDAKQSALNAYAYAWCDGPPFTYKWGEKAAAEILSELGEEEPKLNKCELEEIPSPPKVMIDP